MPLIMLPNPYVYFTHTNLLLSVYANITQLLHQYHSSIFITFICKINYNKSEQISCGYLLTISLYSMHMILWQIMHYSLITALHVFCFKFSRGLFIFTCMQNIMGLFALCLMLLFCTCISHMGTNNHIVPICSI